MSIVTDAPFAAAAPNAPVESCFHCGEPLPETGGHPVQFEGASRPTCCGGCQAVAQTIIGNGLAAYYRNRSALPQKAADRPDVLEALKLYDLPEVQRAFVRAADTAAHEKEAALLLEGITCAACTWLIESRVARLPGITGAAVNYATRRARIGWDDRQTSLSAILRAIRELGYGAEPYDGARSDDQLKRERRAMLWRLFVAGFGMMQIMMYAVPAYVADGAMTADVEQLMRLASLTLTAPVALWAAIPFYSGAWRELKGGRLGMDAPVSAGIIVAFAASVVATLRGSGEVYFDSVAMFVFLLLGARFLEMSARAKAAEAQERLVRLTPAIAERLERYPGGRTKEVPVATLRAGDFVVVRPGAVIPADGIVVEGAGSADESLLTGEAWPVEKRCGDAVIGGAVSHGSPLTVRVTRVGQDTMLSGIVRLMDRAQTEKPHTAAAADRAARWFVAALLAATAVVAAAWYVIDPPRALWVAVAMLVVTCPCALSLATPAALAAATGTLHRSGVLATRGHALETLARATHIVFDKTGTLTTGRMTVVGVLPLGDRGRDEILGLAAALEAQSEHPVGRTIAAAGDAAGTRVEDRRNVPGAGVEGSVGARRLRIGTPAFVAELNRQPLPRELAFIADHVTVVALGDAHRWLGLITVSDKLRPDARRVVRDLKALGKTVCLLSGDRVSQVGEIARELGITSVRAAARPEDKVEFVRVLQREGAVVAMVGDGVNDAPVLAQAQVSIVMQSSAALAQSSADMVLMTERLEPLSAAILTAGRTLTVIRQNLAWAVAYNAVALPLAALGYVTPLFAAIGMSASSLAVVLNALRLLRPPVPADFPAKA